MKWLQSILKLSRRKGGTRKEVASDSNSKRSSRPSLPDTIVVRGRKWKNTAEPIYNNEKPPPLCPVDRLIQDLSKRNRTEIRRAAAEHLGEIGESPDKAIPALLVSALDPDQSVREASFKLTWMQREAMEDCRSLEFAHLAALRFLAKLGTRAGSAIPTIVETLEDSVIPIRAEALLTLVKIGGETSVVVPLLVDGLSSPHATVRHAAFAAFKQLRSLPSLDPKWFVSESGTARMTKLAEALCRSGEAGDLAAMALLNLGASSVPMLVNVLKNSDRVARERAADVLGQLGTEAREAIPALRRVIDDPSKWVCSAAIKALHSISERSRSGAVD